MMVPTLIERFRKEPVDSDAPVLFAISHAGAGASSFSQWRDWMSADVELAAVRLPGRENRMRETPPGTVEDAASQVTEAIESWCPTEFALFGQCSGALIAFEVVRELRNRGSRLPQCLFVASQPPPDAPRESSEIHLLPDREFYAELQGIGVFDADIDYSSPLWNLISPVVRADYAAYGGFSYTDSPPLDVRIVAMVGDRDHLLTEADVVGWSRQTTRDFKACTVSGGHIITSSAEEQIVSVLEPPWE
ncbi:MAG TPA: thioesterase domain-containing protein [Streptosporangiaceae bacterium]|jgi:medium-chain acyl-[acyl-carrier-protein] hydrolase|nr:thioesterase domain-containing protein [Streptosporangiaceae bacterium]